MKADEILALARAATRRNQDEVRQAILMIAANNRALWGGRFASDLETLAQRKATEIDKELASFDRDLPKLVERRPYRADYLPPMRFDAAARDALDRFIRQYQHRDALERRKIPVASRVLICGPSGCGKTSAASIIAQAVGLPLLLVRIDGVVGSHVGETATCLRKVFNAIDSIPAVWVLDEVDAIASTRSGDASGAGRENDRTVNALLTMLDGVHGGIVVCTTNRPELLDSAFARRMDVTISMGDADPVAAVQLVDEHLRVFGFDCRGVEWSGVAVGIQRISYAQAESAALAIARNLVIDGAGAESVTSAAVIVALRDAGGEP